MLIESNLTMMIKKKFFAQKMSMKEFIQEHRSIPLNLVSQLFSLYSLERIGTGSCMITSGPKVLVPFSSLS